MTDLHRKALRKPRWANFANKSLCINDLVKQKIRLYGFAVGSVQPKANCTANAQSS